MKFCYILWHRWNLKTLYWAENIYADIYGMIPFILNVEYEYDMTYSSISIWIQIKQIYRNRKLISGCQRQGRKMGMTWPLMGKEVLLRWDKMLQVNRPFKWVNCMVCGLYLNTTVKKKNNNRNGPNYYNHVMLHGIFYMSQLGIY